MLDRPADIGGAAPIPERGSKQQPPAQQRGPSRDSLSGFISAVRQRRRTLFAVILLVPMCTWLTLRQITPSYTATGSLIYEPSQYALRELQSILHEDPTTDAMMASQAEILHSFHIAEQVARRGNLFEDPEFNYALRPPGLLTRIGIGVASLLGMDTEPPPAEPVYGPVWDATRDQTIATVQLALHATAVRSSHVVEVTFSANDPLVAAAAVNNAMDAYIKEQYAAKHRAVDSATSLLEKQASDLRRQVHSAEERISAYRSEHALSQGVHGSADTEEISNLTEDLAKAQADRATANARLDAARGRAGAQAQAAVASSVASMRAQQEQLAGQLKALQTRLGSAHPEVQALSHQVVDGQRALDAEIARAVTATVAEQRVASERVKTLEENLEEAKAAAAKSAHTEIPLNAMARDLEAAQGQLQAVLERILQTAQQTNIESAEAHEISQAIPPDRPASPRIVQSMAASVAASVFLGLLLVYILHLTDSTLHSSDEMRAVTGLPCLALIPEIGKRALGHLKIHDYVVRRPLTTFAEQVRSLRAGVSLDIDHPQVIAITASRPAEGKSLLALALGRSAQMGGERVLAIECDVRQAAFQFRLSGQAAPGLLEILRGEATWQDTLQNDPITGMKFIAAGKPSGDVLALFLSNEMRQLLAEVREEYDLILLDAPPVEAMTEARIAGALADATLLCVRWRSTPVKHLVRALDVLRESHANIIGTVLTRVDTRVHLRSGYADAGVYHRRYKAYFKG